MTRNRIAVLAGIAVIAAAGVGTGAAIAASGSPGQPAATAAARAAYAAPSYSWYRSMMTGYYGDGGGMMGGSSYGWMMSTAGYQWMTGSGTTSPGWMRGGTLPATMMGAGPGTGMGEIMGSPFANAPGPRVSAAQAAALGSQVPAGAQVSKTGNSITFTTRSVRLTLLASPVAWWRVSRGRIACAACRRWRRSRWGGRRTAARPGHRP
jgi:hypothetical protein